MKKHLTLTLLTSLLFGAAVLLPATAPAQQMNYQGRLTDTNGTALLDGQYILTFSLYAAASGGTAVWGPFACDGNAGNGHAAKADLVSGRFNVILGSLDTAARPLTTAFIGGLPRYLGIKVGTTGIEISPRQQILAAPEALHAMISETVINGAIGTAQLADNSVTAEKISGGTGVWLTTPNGTDIYRGAGNVGIGTTAPAAKLQVAGTVRFGSDTFAKTAGNTGDILLDNGTDDSPGIHFYTAANANYGIDAAAYGLRFVQNLDEAGGTVSMILADGKLGIGGKVLPDATLDVQGTVKMLGARANLFNPWSPAADNQVQSGGVTSDGFLTVVITLFGKPGNNTIARVRGYVDDFFCGAASCNAFVNQDYPVYENSFMMPVPKGSTWTVVYFEEQTDRHADVYIKWTPLGR